SPLGLRQLLLSCGKTSQRWRVNFFVRFFTTLFGTNGFTILPGFYATPHNNAANRSSTKREEEKEKKYNKSRKKNRAITMTALFLSFVAIRFLFLLLSACA
ncbi:hypothetical protein DQ04_27931000, partial [Trypanosoma grayi]|uniref:hypothetical protein n=1 Tax=Trypanosoma grayi TaxID=71804 RepID=UPI0004F4BE70